MSRKPGPAPRRVVPPPAGEPTSACVVVRGRGDLVLAVLHPTGLYGLPGGRRRPGESVLACMARELHEETGLAARTAALLAVDRSDPGHTPHVCAAYYALAHGALRGSREGQAVWVPEHVLTSAAARFAAFNRWLWPAVRAHEARLRAQAGG